MAQKKFVTREDVICSAQSGDSRNPMQKMEVPFVLRCIHEGISWRSVIAPKLSEWPQYPVARRGRPSAPRPPACSGSRPSPWPARRGGPWPDRSGPAPRPPSRDPQGARARDRAAGLDAHRLPAPGWLLRLDAEGVQGLRPRRRAVRPLRHADRQNEGRREGNVVLSPLPKRLHLVT